MPYIAIKSFPKDEKTKKKIVDTINEAFLKIWECPADAITISLEEINPNDWEEKVIKAEIAPQMDKMMIFAGKKMK